MGGGPRLGRRRVAGAGRAAADRPTGGDVPGRGDCLLPPRLCRGRPAGAGRQSRRARPDHHADPRGGGGHQPRPPLPPPLPLLSLPLPLLSLPPPLLSLPLPLLSPPLPPLSLGGWEGADAQSGVD